MADNFSTTFHIWWCFFLHLFLINFKVNKQHNSRDTDCIDFAHWFWSNIPKIQKHWTKFQILLNWQIPMAIYCSSDHKFHKIIFTFQIPFFCFVSSFQHTLPPVTNYLKFAEVVWKTYNFFCCNVDNKP